MDSVQWRRLESGGDGKRAVLNPKELRFTQLDIAPHFSNPEHPNVEEAADLMKRGLLNPHKFGELTVYRDCEGVAWCENNRRLYVLRKAGVESVNVNFNSNSYFLRRLKEKVKDKLRDPSFMPKIRGTATSSSSSQLYPYEGETQSPMLGYPIVEEDLRFAQPVMASSFKNREHPKVDLIKPRLLIPDGFGELTVYTNRVEDVNRCDDSHRLYGSVNDYMPRRLEDPATMPKIKGAASSSSSSRQQSHEEEKETSLLGIVGTASVAVAAGFAAWNLFKGLAQSDDDEKKSKK